MKLYWLLWRLWHTPRYVLLVAWHDRRKGFWWMMKLRWLGLAYWAEIYREEGWWSGKPLKEQP
jgi:hypothetical protein